MTEQLVMGSTGWVKDFADHRDYSVKTEPVHDFLKKAKVASVGRLTLPAKYSLRKQCPPIRNQGPLGSCTAMALVALAEFFQKKVYGKFFAGSPLFTYYGTRDLLGWKGDTGAYSRTTMQSGALFGIATEKSWKYKPANLDVAPPMSAWMIGQNFQIDKYYRLDTPDVSPSELLARVKTNISADLPSMGGIPVYPSISQAATTGRMPFPSADEAMEGGHLIVFIGFDDSMVVTNAIDGVKYQGAIEWRNHWGAWGDGGYGWLSYEWFLRGLVSDIWSICSSEWIDLSVFG